MWQIRIHGRGGQGVVTAAELLSMAAFYDGMYAQAFPTFGSERTGAPVTAFCRISQHPIRTREPVAEPDVLIIQDSTLLHQVDVFQGLSPSGYLLINSTKSFEMLGIAEWCATRPDLHCYTMPASDIAMKHVGRPVPNVALVAGCAALTQWVTLEAVESAVAQRFSGSLQEPNLAVAREAYHFLSTQVEAVRR